MAGVGSTFPAASVDLTSNTWLPTARALYAFGLEQAAATTFSGPSTHGSATGADPVFPLVALRRDVP